MWKQLPKKVKTATLIALWGVLLGMLSVGYAQDTKPLVNSTLDGVVLDAVTREPLVGATLQLEGVTHYTKTDEHGRFRFITGQKFPYTIIVSFVGYQTKNVVATGTPLTIELEQDATGLDEVVVVGYGTQKRSDLTGAIASVPQAALKQSVSSFDRALQGTVAGVQVSQASGQPGSAVSIRIRGGNSINGANEPLYVIDGFPVYNNNNDVDAGVSTGPDINALASLNMSDIESIDVLKDASATAIYGSRGANGVVIITTKKGKSGHNTLTYDGYYGVQRLLKTVPVLTSSRDFALLKNDALVNAGKAPRYTDAEINAMTGGTDWLGAAFVNAPIQNHQLTMTGGDEKTRYALSGGYFGQDGILEHSDFKRYSGRLNLERDFSAKLTVGSNLTASKSTANVASHGIVRALLLMPPNVPIWTENGEYTYQSEFETPLGNPIATLEKEVNETITYRLLGNVYADYRIIEGLTARVSLGVDVVNNKQNYYIPSDIYQGANSNPTGKGFVGSKFVNTWLNENTLSYTKVIGDKHSFNAVLGFTQQAYANEHAVAGSEGFVTDLLTYHDLGSGAVYAQPASGSQEWALNSYLGRINYSFDDRYAITVSGRADGSSRFGKDRKWGFFPSGAVAWNISNEPFFHSASISHLKFRLSAGVTGNQEIGQYQSLATLANNTYFFGDQVYIGFAPNRIANPELGWETTVQYDAGLDISLINRIHVVLDAYYKRTSDLLLNVPLPYTTGQSTSLQNYGEVENKGLEFSINSENLKGAFRWNTQLVFSLNRNKVLSLGDDADYIISGRNIVQVGAPLGSFYGYRTAGIFQEGDDIPNLPTINPAGTHPGDRRYQDLNGDNRITQADDRTLIGNAQPKFSGGITNNLAYKNIDLSIFLQGTYGNRLFNVNRQELELFSGQQNAATSALDRWTPTNPSTTLHRAFEDPSFTHSDYYVEDASYLRLQNITLGYSLPETLTSRLRTGQIRFYISAQNPIIWTRYSGFDPDVSRNEQSTISQGIDNSVYPIAKTYQFGLNVNF